MTGCGPDALACLICLHTIPSASVVNTTVETKAGEILYFRYRVSSESADRLRFYIDGQQVKSWSGDVDWAVYFYQLEAGTHVLQWEYTKDAAAVINAPGACPMAAVGIGPGQNDGRRGYITALVRRDGQGGGSQKIGFCNGL